MGIGPRGAHKGPPSSGAEGRGQGAALSLEEREKIRVDFHRLLTQKYGSIVSAWKAIDSNQDGKLSFFEFLRACQSLGVSDGARRIFGALDVDRSGFISLAEVDAAIAEMMTSLAVTIWSSFGTVEKAWQALFNRRGALRISFQEFQAAAHELGFRGNAAHLFDELASDRASSGMSRKEFGFLHVWISQGQPDRIGSEERESRWAKPTKVSQEGLPPVGGRSVKDWRQQFKTLLLKSYKNYIRAWRQGLDRDHNGHLDYDEFKLAVKDIGFAGNVRELWRQLDDNGNGVVSLWELDMPTAQLLKEFNDCAEASFGSWQITWNEVMDVRGDDRVKIADFRFGCQKMGYRGDISALFDLLDVDCTKFLSWAETAWISGAEVTETQTTGKEKDIVGSYMKLTRQQQRRADAVARDFRVRSKKFEGRARGELPESSPSAGTSVFSPGMKFNEHLQMPKSSSSPLLPAASLTGTSWRRKESVPDWFPDWLLVAEGRKAAEPRLQRADLSFPLAPQRPGKGGWPSRKLNLVDTFWGGSKDIGQLLSPLSREACLPENLQRWKSQSFHA